MNHISEQFSVREAQAADLNEVRAWLQPQDPQASAAEPGRLLAAPEEQRWLVAADDAGRLFAGARLLAHIGQTVPRCWYHVGLAVHAAPELRLFKQQRTLLLGNNLTGSAELRDIGLAPPATASTTGLPWAALAAVAALAQAAQHRVRADPAAWGSSLIVELPGWHDSEGQSPFWHGLTRHFYRGDPAEARSRLGPQWRSHLAALLPRQPLYASFLPEAAQAAIGQHAPGAADLRAALESAGLFWRSHVTVDDGAAVLEWRPGPAPRAATSSVSASTTATTTASAVAAQR